MKVIASFLLTMTLLNCVSKSINDAKVDAHRQPSSTTGSVWRDVFGQRLETDQAWAEESLEPVRSRRAILFTQTLDLGVTEPEVSTKIYKKFYRTYDKALHSTTQEGVNRWNWCEVEVDGVEPFTRISIPQGRVLMIEEGIKGGRYTTFPLSELKSHRVVAYLSCLYNSMNPVGLSQLPKVLLEDTLKISFDNATGKFIKEQSL